jgi:hypothetical protein
MTGGAVELWTIYDHPRDFPGGFIARRWVIGDGAGPVATADCITAPDLDSLRAILQDEGLVVLARDESDDPVIVETWI